MKEKKPIIVSACLAGISCAYDGDDRGNPRVIELVKQGKAIPVCPEQLGGMSTPRKPSERKGNKVVSIDGKDVTKQFEKGADEVCRLCGLVGCETAILKAKSPSCGVGKTYDGTFSGTLIKRDGTTAEKLRGMGIKLLTEEQL